MNIIIADLYVEEKDMDRPWNSLQKNPVQTAKMHRGKAQRGQVQESKIQTDKIKKEKPQRMIVTDETSVYGIDMACFHEKQEE